MKYDWIFFDADDTLFHFDGFKGLQLMFSRKGVDFTEQDFAEYQLVNKPLWKEYQNRAITAEQLKEMRFNKWAEKLNVKPMELNTDYMHAMAEIATLLPGAQELMDALVDKAQVGIITNGFTDLQAVRLAKTGMGKYIKRMIVSEEVGTPKPDPIIFNYALEQVGNPCKSRVLMVGDTLHSDVLGGINAGIDTCWLNPKGEEATDGIEPKYNVRSLSELQAILEA
ncbi:MAG: pyrimidine 5'-nucleotidase [Vibrio sp.]